VDLKAISPDSPGWRSRHIELLEDNVRREIEVQNAMGSLGLTDQQIKSLAWAITAEVDYAFDVRWSPDWVGPGEAHVWVDGGQVFARCGQCMQESPPLATKALAREWFVEHNKTHT
jgi:hypothetical protein